MDDLHKCAQRRGRDYLSKSTSLQAHSGPFLFVLCVRITLARTGLSLTVRAADLTAVGGGMSGLIFAWANEVCLSSDWLRNTDRMSTQICAADNEERALVTASMNDFAYVMCVSYAILSLSRADMYRSPQTSDCP
jgi:hypothetical protein